MNTTETKLAELRAQAAALRGQRLSGRPWHAADAAKLAELTAEIRRLSPNRKAK